MTQVVAPSTSYEATLEAGVTGLVGTLKLGVYDGDTATEALSTATINEIGTSGVYVATRTSPAAAGQYVLLWTLDGTLDPDQVITEDLLVTSTAPSAVPSEPTPCMMWVTSDEVADCCESFAGGTDPEALALLEPFAEAATDILFGISGGAYKGECGPVTVRPCNDSCSCFAFLDGGWSWDRLSNRWYNGRRSCGCHGTSEVHLSGWPREIIEVRIDGVALGGDEYRLDDGFKLVRLRDPADPDRRLMWPGCQIIDLDDTEPGTFAVDYTYGVDPPQAAKDAAVALACQLFAACNPASGRCALPTGTRALVRAGVTINLQAIGESLKAGATGILAIDAFIARYGDDPGQPTVWSPDIAPYPRRVGQIGT